METKKTFHGQNNEGARDNNSHWVLRVNVTTGNNGEPSIIEKPLKNLFDISF
jgi:hypothetical protein